MWLNTAAAADPQADRLIAEIRPYLEEFCFDCHHADLAEGELDLDQLTSISAPNDAVDRWQQVREMIDGKLMPPPDAPQPSDDQTRVMSQRLNEFLRLKAEANAGDPGPVVLRRLCNAEYRYTIRDLTGVDSLDPVREFPVDGAAGEGFTNVGNALAMSPALATKYLDAAKEIASHAILLPDGIGFSAKTTRRDWTDERLKQIRAIYSRYALIGGGEQLNLQGVIVNSNEGGAIPIEVYLRATLANRDALLSNSMTIEEVAASTKLNPKYLALLWNALTAKDSSYLLDSVRRTWRTATPGDEATLRQAITAWQQKLWKFNSVGQLGKVGGPTQWMNPISPLAARHEFRRDVAPPPNADDVVFCLVAGNGGDAANGDDVVIWDRPRLSSPGRPDLLLCDVQQQIHKINQRRLQIASSAASCLAAVAEARAQLGGVSLAELTDRHGVDATVLQAWLDYLGIGLVEPASEIDLLKSPLANVAGHEFVSGWQGDEFPQIIANASGQEVHIPGLALPHSIVVHPGPNERALIVWQSPVAAKLQVTAKITHAHPACGNGVTWKIEHRRGRVSRRLAEGIAHGPAGTAAELPNSIDVQPGDQLYLSIGPREGDHSCDLTGVELEFRSLDDSSQQWNLAADVSSDLTAANPHADRLGHAAVWHFGREHEEQASFGTSIPTGSLIDRWLSASSDEERAALAVQLADLLSDVAPGDNASPDAVLYRQLTSWRGPFFQSIASGENKERPALADANVHPYGLPASRFGHAPDGSSIESASLSSAAPDVIEIRLPAAIAADSEFVVDGLLHPQLGREGSVQLDVVMGSADSEAVQARVRSLASPSPDVPTIVTDDGVTRGRLEAEIEAFRQLFPATLCYWTIVPVDEVVTLTLFHREDSHLMRLMLSGAEQSELDRLWDELHYISQDAFTRVDALSQLIEYATQDADPSQFIPLREPFDREAAAFRDRLVQTESAHLDGLLKFAGCAFRRPLSTDEEQELRQLYQEFRTQELDHESAVRLTLARILASPAYLYRLEETRETADSHPVSDWELATRLSYFLWSSTPDEELRTLAAAGKLHDSSTLVEQIRRISADERIARLSDEFGRQWLHVRGFESNDEKSERHFPSFNALRESMARESTLFFTDLFQGDRSILSLIDADHAFLNEELAQHYGIPDVTGPDWRRVDGVRQYGRGGILAQATTLATHSGASRTSPILRGVWVSEVLLGERLPKPPPGVPPLPDDQAADDALTVRQLVERHVSDPDCAGCHRRIDPLGMALERYDAIGRMREVEPNGERIDAQTIAPDGVAIDGFEGLANYIGQTRRTAFVRQFCRKLLGFALGRSVQLSDEPLLAKIEARLAAEDFRIGAAIEEIVLSRQFQERRGLNSAAQEHAALQH